jgi:4,5-dihydroxyphthalate decarboxylase
VTWVITEDAHVAEYEPPANVEMHEGADPAIMLASGDIDALLAPRIQAGEGQKLLWTEQEAEDVAVGYWRRTGVYPIGHIMVAKDETLQANPWIVASLFRAFNESKLIYLNELHRRSQLNARDNQVIHNQEIIGGDPLPHGLARNRTALEAAVQMNFGQHVIQEPLDIDSLFAPGSADLE